MQKNTVWPEDIHVERDSNEKYYACSNSIIEDNNDMERSEILVNDESFIESNNILQNIAET